MYLLHYAIYNSTGAITKVFSVLPDDTITVGINTRKGETALLTDVYPDPSVYYVVGGVLTIRPPLSDVATWNKTFIKADDTETAVLGASLPNPSTVSITPLDTVGMVPVYQQVTDGSVVVKSAYVGGYKVNISAFPYKDHEAIVGIGRGYIDTSAISTNFQEVKISERVNISTIGFVHVFDAAIPTVETRIATKTIAAAYDSVGINASTMVTVDTLPVGAVTVDMVAAQGYLVIPLTSSLTYPTLTAGTVVYISTQASTITPDSVNVWESIRTNTDYTPTIFNDMEVVIDQRNSISTSTHTLTYGTVTV